MAVALAAEGALMWWRSRATVGGLEELDDDIKKEGGTATLVPLDLKDFSGIDRMAAAVHERWGRLDALFGNAGILGALTPVAHLNPKTWDDTMAINVTANWRLIRALDPLLRQSDAGRALFVTSGGRASQSPLLGRLRHQQGRTRNADLHLCRGMQRHQCQGQCLQSRSRRARACGPRPCPAKTR